MNMSRPSVPTKKGNRFVDQSQLASKTPRASNACSLAQSAFQAVSAARRAIRLNLIGWVGRLDSTLRPRFEHRQAGIESWGHIGCIWTLPPAESHAAECP